MSRLPGLGGLHGHRRAIYLVVAMLSVAGIWAGRRLPSAIYPELEFTRVTIVSDAGVLGVRQVLFGVIRPIEEAVAVVPGVTRVESRAIRGGGETTISFAPGTDMANALQQVQARVNQVQPDLPPGIGLQVERLTPSLFPILSYNLEGGDPAELLDIARYRLRPQLSRIPGVARVDVMGSVGREIEVIADPVRLAARGFTWDALAGAIRDATTVTALGQAPADYRQYLLLAGQEIHADSMVADLVVGPQVRVRDLATVRRGTTDRVRLVTGDGHPSAFITVSRQPGGNTLAIADSIASLSRRLAPSLPPGVRLVPVYDQAVLVRDAVQSVRDAMLLGAVLAVVVLLAFLGDLRVTAISAAVIPLTMAITTLVMSLLGQTFNLMTLGAMAVAIGLVIDDAVVVTENIVRQLAATGDRLHAVGLAVRELAWPVTTSTLTTVVVFLPLGLLTGVEGQFFRTLALTLTVAVTVSLLLAFTLIPVLAGRYLREPSGEAPGETERFAGLSEWYGRSLERVLGRRGWVLGVAALLLVGGGVGYRMVGTGFLPEIDEGAFVLDYFTPGGTALPETDRQLKVVEQILLDTPEVEAISRRTGAELGLFATGQNTGDFIVRLRPPSARTRRTQDIIDDVRGRIETSVPQLRIEFVQILTDVINDLAGVRSPVELKLFGSDLDALEAYGQTLASRLVGIPGLEDIYDGVSEPAAEMTMTVATPALRQSGLTPADLTAQVSGALTGVVAGQVLLDDRGIGIRVRAPDAVRFAPEGLAALPVLVPGQRQAVPLATFASFAPHLARGELWRENQQQLITLTADLGARPLGDVMRDVRRVLAEVPAPHGITVQVAGQDAGQQAAFRALLGVLLLAAVSVVAVMVVQFRSFTEPLVILFAAPLSFVGALLLLTVTGTVLNVSSIMGLIFLVGLVVKNGIILLDFVEHRLADGAPLRLAVVEAARIRLRPILMTTLCTLFGLFPLALGLGAGSEMQRPLALAVIGGLALSTPVTLYLVPTLFLAIRERGAPIHPLGD
ncbi:MAG TPA: efflux RND transporter permease subunit [Gemmatimonadales bacterium]|nr:efflux RND transporter permease subunit [Gemmatimonadales bacterium]HRX19136.1 efflux RND transporter permease subunit [Gemmatimonadales bacterium]